jgi:hypothetical protein
MTNAEAIKLIKAERRLLQSEGDPKEFPSALDLAEALDKAIKALEAQEWRPVSEKSPRINKRVLLQSNDGTVFVGRREKPEIIWQVTEADGRKHWVYDPENYTDDIESLPKGEDCSFESEAQHGDGLLSVNSLNYDSRFEGVTGWKPLPEPYKEDGNEQTR